MQWVWYDSSLAENNRKHIPELSPCSWNNTRPHLEYWHFYIHGIVQSWINPLIPSMRMNILLLFIHISSFVLSASKKTHADRILWNFCWGWGLKKKVLEQATYSKCNTVLLVTCTWTPSDGGCNMQFGRTLVLIVAHHSLLLGQPTRLAASRGPAQQSTWV